MCFITNYLAKLLSGLSEITTTVLGSSILVSVGFYNFFKGKNNMSENVNTPALLLVGFAVGLDGAMANLSLSIMGINAFYVPIVIALMHALMVFIGITLASTKVSKKLDKYKFFAPLILIFLGVYKLVSLFI
jgi:putative Mn2+ efflux pump MntP